MKISHLTSAPGDPGFDEFVERLRAQLAEGRSLVVTVAEEGETLSPQQVAGRLGFSRQHVMRLIAGGGLMAEVMPGSRYRRIPLSSVLAFEESRGAARRLADEHSRALDAAGAPLE